MTKTSTDAQIVGSVCFINGDAWQFTVTITSYRDGKQIGTLHTELTLHTAYLWPKEVQ